MINVKKIILLLIINLFLGYIPLFSQEIVSIGVIELDAVGISKNDSKIISARLRTDLFNTGKFTVLEREKMDEILNEQGFQQSGCTSNECVIEVGKLTGVQQIVAGNIGKIGNLITISIRLIDVQTGKVIRTATEDCECSIETVVTQSVNNVAQILAGAKVKTSTYKTNNPSTDFHLQTNNNSAISLIEWKKLGRSENEWLEFGNSNLKFEKWLDYKRNIKSTAWSTTKSLLIPGLGQLSLKQKRGFLYFLVDVTSVVFFINYNEKGNEYEDEAYHYSREEPGRNEYLKKSDDAFKVSNIFMNLWILNRIICPIDTYISTKNHNKKINSKFNISHGINLDNQNLNYYVSIELKL